MSNTNCFHHSMIYGTPAPKRNTELPDEAWYLPISDAYAQNIQNLIVQIESQWLKELQQQHFALSQSDPALANDFPMPPSPMRYGEAVAYQIMRQDFRFLEVEAAALGFALVPVNYVHLFDATQLKLLSNSDRLMEILQTYGTGKY